MLKKAQYMVALKVMIIFARHALASYFLYSRVSKLFEFRPSLSNIFIFLYTETSHFVKSELREPLLDSVSAWRAQVRTKKLEGESKGGAPRRKLATISGTPMRRVNHSTGSSMWNLSMIFRFDKRRQLINCYCADIWPFSTIQTGVTFLCWQQKYFISLQLWLFSIQPYFSLF